MSAFPAAVLYNVSIIVTLLEFWVDVSRTLTRHASDLMGLYRCVFLGHRRGIVRIAIIVQPARMLHCHCETSAACPKMPIRPCQTIIVTRKYRSDAGETHGKLTDMSPHVGVPSTAYVAWRCCVERRSRRCFPDVGCALSQCGAFHTVECSMASKSNKEQRMVEQMVAWLGYTSQYRSGLRNT